MPGYRVVFQLIFFGTSLGFPAQQVGMSRVLWGHGHINQLFQLFILDRQWQKLNLQEHGHWAARCWPDCYMSGHHLLLAARCSGYGMFDVSWAQSCLSIVPLLMTEWTLVPMTKRAWAMSCRVGDLIVISRASELWRLIASEWRGWCFPEHSCDGHMLYCTGIKTSSNSPFESLGVELP